MAIGEYIDGHNQNSKPIIWIAKARDILEKAPAHALFSINDDLREALHECRCTQNLWVTMAVEVVTETASSQIVG
jgi:hypothetical protein